MEKVYTKNAPEAIGPYSQGIICGGLVFTSGQIPVNPESGNVEVEGIKEQTEQVMKNIKAVLEEAGSSLDKIVKTTCFIQNMDDFAQFNEVYAEYIFSIAKEFNIDARVIGRCEAYEGKKLTIRSEYGEFIY